MYEPMVEVEALSFLYGERVALRDVTLSVDSGALFGLLGPNGGGKTTLIQILATLRKPAMGNARVAGLDVVDDATGARRQIGVVFQHASLDPYLTVAENLRHQGHLYGLKGQRLEDRIDVVLTRSDVVERRADLVKTLSGGLRRRVELAKGLLHQPCLLLLDEPTVGLDPTGRREFWDHLAELRVEIGVTVIAATHLMEEADRCDRIGIIDEGSLVALDSPTDLKKGIRGEVIAIETDDPAELASAITARFGAEASIVNGAVRIERHDGAAFVPRLAEAFPGRIQSITVGRPTLEDVFVQRTGHQFEAGEL